MRDGKRSESLFLSQLSDSTTTILTDVDDETCLAFPDSDLSFRVKRVVANASHSFII